MLSGVVTDSQVRKMMRMKNEGKSLEQAAMAGDMDVKTARKYYRSGKLPSQGRTDRKYRTRKDPFEDVWEEVTGLCTTAPGLEAKTVFAVLQEKHPGRFQDGQLRTLQRKIKIWKATNGPGKEVFFSQVYRPGEWCASDFTNQDDLGVTISGRSFPHMLYHFVLPYSNWEDGSVCFSESFEGLSVGLQNALWRLGGCPQYHRTDRLSAAVNSLKNPAEFRSRYTSLLAHYGLEGRKTNVGRSNENGDVEQSHYRFKKALEQHLLLRGSRDFESRNEYEDFIRLILEKKNRGRESRLSEELKMMKGLPSNRIEDCRRVNVKVGHGSTIHVGHVTYSVHSRLIGERVDARLFVDRLEVWYAQRKVDEIPRQRVEKGHFIQYRHIIDWLLRKPGAFDGYRYREDLFPGTNFRIAYDRLTILYGLQKGAREYLQILNFAVHYGEERVSRILANLHADGEFDSKLIFSELETNQEKQVCVEIPDVNLGTYDQLLDEEVA